TYRIPLSASLHELFVDRLHLINATMHCHLIILHAATVAGRKGRFDFDLGIQLPRKLIQLFLGGELDWAGGGRTLRLIALAVQPVAEAANRNVEKRDAGMERMRAESELIGYAGIPLKHLSILRPDPRTLGAWALL
ncbi:hypothetical protein PENTCL1PPCAC_4940, partial [Pristionchus entomophagus]